MQYLSNGISDDALFPTNYRELSENHAFFSLTRAGWVIPTVTSSISFFSSGLIIYIIARSEQSTYTITYHRIMFLMSIADMVSSLAVSLTTIPMPKDVNKVYNFEGKSYGTVLTCEIQGFSYGLGLRLSLAASICLNVYYLLTIRYRVPHRVITKCAEPVFVIITLLVSVIPPLFALKNKMYNPTPLWSWCTISEFPYGCSKDNDVDCIHSQHIKAFRAGSSLYLIIAAALQALCLVLIVTTAYKRGEGQKRTILHTDVSKPQHDEEKLQAPIEIFRDEDGEVHDQEKEQSERNDEVQDSNKASQQDTRMIANYALMYTAAFIGTHSFFPFFSPHSTILMVFALVFRPLQGFFNSLIFISQKVYIIRQAHEQLSFCEALTMIMRSPSVVPGIVIELPHIFNTPRNISSREGFFAAFPSTRSSHDPSLVVSKSDGGAELPTDRDPGNFLFYEGVRSPAVPSINLSYDSSLVESKSAEDTELPTDRDPGEFLFYEGARSLAVPSINLSYDPSLVVSNSAEDTDLPYYRDPEEKT